MLIYNTQTGGKEKLVTREPGKVAIYVCGPTTYNYIHLGNARPVVFFDTVRRYFKYKGYEVLYVQNFTDVDDKIINRAREEKEEPLALAARYIKEYFRDADALNVMRADIHPLVSEHIGEIVDLVRTLVDKGYAYAVDGDVYYDVRSFAGYGNLSGRSLEDMRAGARVDVDERKHYPMDFALWKAAKPGEPAWDTPWGKGRPGWHIECSAMSLKYLGANFDIHGGGFDLIFPHHENERAQSEAATGQPFVRYWMHNGFITIAQEKMSKSLGNFFLVREILDQFKPEVVRFYLLSAHYRSLLDFDDDKLAAAGKGLERLKNSLRLLDEALAGGDPDIAVAPEAWLSGRLDELRTQFEAAMDDDFNTALATGIMFDLARDVNSFLQGEKANSPAGLAALKKARTLFFDFNGVLGFLKTDGQGKILLAPPEGEDESLVEELVRMIIQIRQEARQNKDWAAADRIRDQLKELGIVLEDTSSGVRWKKGT
ncbi:MAG: cysteine--tRNA ligase [Firmicutes bacterium]|nr:cysteine--tRNA ligase [Bacillota bacterium]